MFYSGGPQGSVGRRIPGNPAGEFLKRFPGGEGFLCIFEGTVSKTIIPILPCVLLKFKDSTCYALVSGLSR